MMSRYSKDKKYSNEYSSLQLTLIKSLIIIYLSSRNWWEISIILERNIDRQISTNQNKQNTKYTKKIIFKVQIKLNNL